jgi:hypothetical protein
VKRATLPVSRPNVATSSEPLEDAARKLLSAALQSVDARHTGLTQAESDRTISMIAAALEIPRDHVVRRLAGYYAANRREFERGDAELHLRSIAIRTLTRRTP